MLASLEFLFLGIQIMMLVCGAIAIKALSDWRYFYFHIMTRIKFKPKRIPPNHFYGRNQRVLPSMSEILGLPRGFKMNVPFELFQKIYNEAVVMQQKTLHKKAMTMIKGRPKYRDEKYRNLFLAFVEDMNIYDEFERGELEAMAKNERIEYMVTYKDAKIVRFSAVINMAELYGESYFEDFEGDRYFIYHFIINK